MIRVVCRWRVKPENFDALKETWSDTTRRIHESAPGAPGSFMLRALENTEEVLTVARWDSLASLKVLWGNFNPEEMTKMRELGERISVEAYDQIEDYSR